MRNIMRLLTHAFGFFLLVGCSATAVAPAAAQLRPEVETFIGEMVNRHGFSQAELESILGMAQFQPTIIDALSRPATSRPWYEFRTLFINPKRIAGGVAFWNSHAEILERARREFGIPEEIIVA